MPEASLTLEDDLNPSDFLIRCGQTNDYEAWNKYRKKYRKVQFYFENLQLSNLNFSRFNLQNVQFESSKCHHVNFETTQLTNSEFQNCDFFGSSLTETNLVSAHLTHCSFSTATFSHADLRYAVMNTANIHQADFISCDLSQSSLVGASIVDSNFYDCRFYNADLSSSEWQQSDLSHSNFERSKVDGATLIWDCYYDVQTLFSGVGLSGCRIEPVLASALAYNNRRHWWLKWYQQQLSVSQNPLVRAIKYIKTSIVKAFWWMTDYGSSTTRLLLVFLLNILIFTGIYLMFPDMINLDITATNDHLLLNFLNIIYFCVVTMTSVGFGDIHASSSHPVSLIIISIQAVLGYILLGAFLVRVGILFQGEFPAPKSNPKRREHQ